mmetsp:Transcript_39152/g.68883  ORF Transcript_39152/g.68883 Transcript_39152/m.68883 type:complete len:130 (-) Transcript_39152:29-418(-)
MGFVILFDVTDSASLRHAKDLHKEMCGRQDFKKKDFEPVVYFVANKIDKDPFAEEVDDNKEELLRYAKEAHPVRFKIMEVSASEFTHVRKLFREMIEDIVLRKKLWMTEADEAREKGGKEGNQEDCSVQ